MQPNQLRGGLVCFQYVYQCFLVVDPWQQSKSKLLYDWRSVGIGSEYPCGTCDQILLPVGMLLSEICGLVSVRRPLWREEVKSSYIMTDGQSASLSWRQAPLSEHTAQQYTGWYFPFGPSQVYKSKAIIAPSSAVNSTSVSYWTELKWTQSEKVKGED
jgi:hypothetical protein